MDNTSAKSGILQPCVLPIVLRALMFLIVGFLGLILLWKYVVTVGEKVFDYRGDASIAGRILVFVLFTAAELAAIVAAVWTANFVDGQGWFRVLRGRSSAVATGQKILLISLVLQLLILPAWHSAYLKSYFAIAFCIYLVTLGFGFTLWRQVLWICLGILPTFSVWLFTVIDVRGSNSSLLFTMLLPVGLVIFQLVIILMLSRRASNALRAAGVTVKFFGVPFAAIPPLFMDSGPSMPKVHPEDLHPQQPGNEIEASAPPSPGFFYLGPNNEPIGPISSDVLLQFRESGVVNDDTLVAPEGESEWKPLRVYLEITEEVES